MKDANKDPLRDILEYLQTEYSCPYVSVFFGYKMKFEPVIRFILPNYEHIMAELPAQNMVMMYKRYGAKFTNEMIDNAIEQMLMEIRERFGEF